MKASALKKLTEKFIFNHPPPFAVVQIEWIPLKKPLTINHYVKWLEEKKHVDMDYLEKHLELKKDPKKISPHLQSCLVMSFKYVPVKQKIFSFLKIAKYAQHEDYHHGLKDYLDKIAAYLKTHFAAAEFISFVDSGPILERDLAYQAGLGWVGKNTLLIHPKHGSYTFLCSLFSSLEIIEQSEEAPKAVADFCGKCNRCIESCPTQALEVRSLDANKCISYWTIESRSEAPADLRAQFSQWFFGCDICQDVCPWNQKTLKAALLPEQNPTKDQIARDITEILSASNSQLQKKIRGTPLQRAGTFGLRRNALYIVEQMKLTEVALLIKNWAQRTDSKLSSLAKEILKKF
jgi:epoxyqueuosine reductase